jgi:hypothetical protein
MLVHRCQRQYLLYLRCWNREFLLESLPKAVEVCLIEGSPDELQPDRKSRGRQTARHREARKSSEICRPRQAGELQTHESFVAVYIYFPLPYFRW